MRWTKKRVGIFFGGLTLMLVGYVAWCWREFYVDPRFVWDESISPEERGNWKENVADEFGIRKATWSIEDAWEHLKRPYRTQVARVRVKKTTWGYVVEISAPQGDLTAERRRSLLDGHWFWDQVKAVP